MEKFVNQPIAEMMGVGLNNSLKDEEFERDSNAQHDIESMMMD